MSERRLLHARASVGHVVQLRIAVFGTWTAILGLRPFPDLASVPGELVVPHGLARVSGLVVLLQSADALLVVHVVAIAACGLTCVGVGPRRLVGGLAVVLLAVEESMIRSVAGFLIHSRLALLLVAVLIVSAVEVAQARDGVDGDEVDTPARLFHRAAVVVALTYSFVAARRLLGGGVEMFTGPSLDLWFAARSLQASEWGFTFGLAVLEHDGARLAARGAFLLTTVFELGSPFALRHTAFRRAWLVVIGGFHVAVALTMNLVFLENLLLLVLLFTAWTSVRAPAALDASGRRWGVLGSRLPVRRSQSAWFDAVRPGQRR